MGQVETARISRAERQGPRRRNARLRRRGASLGLAATRTDDLVRQIERGLPFKALESLAALSGLPVNLFASVLGIPERTLARRKAAGRLAPDESERLVRGLSAVENAPGIIEGGVAGA